MRQRNMVYTGPTIDNEIEHVHLHPGHGPLPTGITFMAAPPLARVVPVPVNPGLHNQLLFPSHPIMDGVHGAFKEKIAEGFHVNFQYAYPAPGLSPFMVHDYRRFDVIPVVMGPGLHHGSIAGAIDLNLGLQFVPMSHGQVVPGPWLDPQFCGNAPGIPYMQGFTNGNLVTFVHQPPPPMPRFVGPTPPIGARVYQPHGQEPMPESTSSRHRGLPRLRALPEDGVAMLDFANYGHRVDHHRDMRLDIDHMSYEELLALGERIGNAGSGLCDDFVLRHLKTRIFTFSYVDDTSSADQEINFCTICQMEYNNQENIGMLDCNHEYHVDCIRKWLAVKNTCPVCKCTGLALEEP